MSQNLISSLDLVHRVVGAAVAYTIARMQVLERIAGNPAGIAYQMHGPVAALMARNLPSVNFNSVHGLRKGQAEQIRPLVEWYRGHGVQARFEIAAGDYDHELGRELTALGFFQSGCHAALIGQIDHTPPPLAHAPVELVETAEQMEDFLSAYVLGWGFPEAIHDQFKSNVRPWLGQPGWSLYLMRVGGRPAAEAVLFMHGGVAYIADCATDPAFRGRGLQVALLGRCIQEAKNANAEFVCSGADFLSTSHRNMERAGLRLLSLRFIWTQLERGTF